MKKLKLIIALIHLSLFCCGINIPNNNDQGYFDKVSIDEAKVIKSSGRAALIFEMNSDVDSLIIYVLRKNIHFEKVSILRTSDYSDFLVLINTNPNQTDSILFPLDLKSLFAVELMSSFENDPDYFISKTCSDLKSLSFINFKMNEFEFDDLVFAGGKVLTIENSEISKIAIYQFLQGLYLINSSIIDGYIGGNIEELILYKVKDISELSMPVYNYKDNHSSKTELYIQNTSFNNIIDFDYAKCNINSDFYDYKIPYQINKDIYLTEAGVLQTMEDIKKNQENNGYTLGLKNISIKYQSFKNKIMNKTFTNIITKWWWSYGFEKEKTIKNTFWIFAIFLLINFFLMDYLILNVYKIDTVFEFLESQKNKSKIIKTLSKVYASVYYTTAVFFGIKFSTGNFDFFDNLSVKKIFGILYFMIMYVGGLVCLGYIANVIITN